LITASFALNKSKCWMNLAKIDNSLPPPGRYFYNKKPPEGDNLNCNLLY
jgi:hypothetical protein